MGFLFSLMLLLGLSACVEVIDDLSFNADGSGTYRYNVNMSSSKVKINSLLALDSLNGKKVPSIEEIQTKVNEVIQKLKAQPGIHNVTFSENYTDYIFKLQFDFESLELMQKALQEIAEQEIDASEITNESPQWLVFENDMLVRSIPKTTVDYSKQIPSEDLALLKDGSYTSITRFDAEISSFSNPNGTLSKNKKAVMVRTDPHSLVENPSKLDNTIYLLPKE